MSAAEKKKNDSTERQVSLTSDLTQTGDCPSLTSDLCDLTSLSSLCCCRTAGTGRRSWN